MKMKCSCSCNGIDAFLNKFTTRAQRSALFHPEKPDKASFYMYNPIDDII